MKQWRVGIVGLRRGQGLVSTLAAHPRVQIAALCDLDQALLEDFTAPGICAHESAMRGGAWIDVPLF
jgi:predicted dehydrogenase